MVASEALGLATNIVQLVDFISKLVSNAVAIYKSANQASAGNLVLQDVANDLIRLSSVVVASNSPGGEGLKQLAQSTKEVAKDLLAILDCMQTKGQKTKWKSFLLAMKEVRNKETVTSITSSVTRLQLQMTLHLQFQIKEDMASISQHIQDLENTSHHLQLSNAKELEKLRADLLGAFNAVNTTCMNQAEKSLVLDLERLSLGNVHTLSRTLPNYANKISTLSESVDAVADHQEVMKAFYFDKLSAREEKIAKAHANTFEWVFSDVLSDGKTKIGFSKWLRDGNGIFWVRGKAGSGKSTLMKLISHHPTTLHALRQWSGSHQLVMGRFYFWNPGTDLQKSQEGLFRSLIFETLQQCPELSIHAKKLFMNEQCSTSHLSTQLGNRADWKLGELADILSGILNHDRAKRFFFSIDGLDEYKAQYTLDHQDLIDALHKLAASPNVKLCVSSRPWTVFMDAFDRGIDRCLKLEDLTRDDIRAYIKDKFKAHNQYTKLMQIDPSYSSLVDDVVGKSQGVFLWVFLVVRELLDGLTYHDSLKTMQQRVDSFPGTLEKFFQHMLDSIPEIYRPQTAKIFQVSALYDFPLPMILYSFLEDFNDNPHLITERVYRPMGSTEFKERWEKMHRRLDAWCKGLLEVDEPLLGSYLADPISPQVNFLHRTVQDFVLSDEVAFTLKSPNNERRRIWLQFRYTIIHCYRRFSSMGNAAVSTLTKILVYFSGKGEKDGIDCHAINNITLDLCDAVLPPRRCEVNFKLILHAIWLGQPYIIKFITPLLEEEGLDGVMSRCLSGAKNSESTRLFISCVEARGLSSKAVFKYAFSNYLTWLATQDPVVTRDKRVLSIVKAIASTGYKLDGKLVATYFPDHYSELMCGAPSVGGGRKRELEDGAATHERKRVRAEDISD